MTLIIGVAVGLFVGWWFLPQPQWAQDLYTRLKTYFQEGEK